MSEYLGTDPCDGWPWAYPSNGYRLSADRSEPVCLEGFHPRDVTPQRAVLGTFLPFVRTDYAHWSNDLDWTLESGPDDAPSSIEIVVPYDYRGGCHDYFAGGCWNPGDPPEVETGQPWFVNDAGQRCEVSLLEPEQERVEAHIYGNPPDDDYPEDY